MPISLWTLFLLAAALGSAHPLSFGFKAGVPLNGLLTAASPGYRAATQRYTLGPTAELQLPHHLAFEAALLYKRLKYGFVPAGSESAVSRWELPLLLQYRLTGRPVEPFLGVGASFNRVTGIHGQKLAELRHRSTMGYCIAIGAQRRLGVIRLAPEVRFTHWVDRNLGVRDAPLRSNLTQAEILIGLSF